MDNLINKAVKNLKVQALYQDRFREVTRQGTVGHWFVFFFYPADFTFVCPTKLGDLSDLYEDFKEAEYEIYFVSEDTHFVHRAWANASDTIKEIRYPMLGDPAGMLARNFDVLVEEEGQALKGTFIVDPEGKTEVYEVRDMRIGRNAQELLRRVQAAQFVEKRGDQVCPTKWKPGEETLTPNLDLIGIL